ncbi:MAG: TIGR00730 family Rossman fold protein [Paludibacteraceae bacterium]|nr:TIGR00730 family Rossman fold protein [Paludibacteraceae bacterium]
MNVAVYCSAKDSIPEEYKLMGDELGEWLAKEGHHLVYGGATGGLMSRVSNAFQKAKQADQKIIGVIPPTIKKAGRLATNCDELIEVQSMAERKQSMRKIADCFIVLPGSYGTLDELFDVIASGTVSEHRKKVYVVNYRGYYDCLFAEVAHMKELGFLPAEEFYKPIFVESLSELFTLFKV